MPFAAVFFYSAASGFFVFFSHFPTQCKKADFLPFFATDLQQTYKMCAKKTAILVYVLPF